jgi:type IV pilus assembly protein PilM
MIGHSRFGPIGLDLGSKKVRAVQLRWSRTGAAISAASCIARQSAEGPISDAEARRIVSTLWRQGFAGTNVVIGVPVDRVVSGVLELPSRSSGAPLEAIARQELARSIKCDAAKLEVAWWELPATARASEGMHAIAVGCRHEDSLPLLGAIEKAGLNPVAIDVPSVALTRAVAPLAGPPPELTAVLEMGQSAAQLMILHGRVLVYERIMRELGGEQLSRSLRQEMGIEENLTEFVLRKIGCGPEHVNDEGMEQAEEVRTLVGAYAESVASELRASMSYAQRRFDGPVTRMLATGEGAEVPGLIERIGQRAGIESRAVRADQLIASSTVGDTDMAGTCGVRALGLALHAAPGRDQA